MRPDGRPAEARLRIRLLRWSVAAALAVALWPPLGAPLDGSFDSSWRWGAAVVAARDLPAGLLPIGPLGTWIEPRSVESAGLRAAAVLGVVLRLLWTAGLAGLFAAAPSPGRWAGLAVVWIGGAAVAQPPADEALVVLVLVLMAPWWLPGAEPRSLSPRPLAAALLAGFAALLKASAGLEAVAALAGAVAVGALARRRINGRALGALGAAAIGGFALGAALAFDSGEQLARWAVAVPEVLRGYGDTMALDATGPARLAAASALLVPAAAAGFALARRSPASGLWATGAVPLVLVVRHALVRPDVHVLGLTAWSIAVLGLAVVAAARRGEAAFALAAGALTLAMAWPQARAVGVRLDPPALARRLSGFEGARDALAGLRPGRRREELARVGERRLRALERPDLARLERSEGGIDAIPWRLSLLAANGLERAWVPSPSLQFFQASTPELERRQAEHFRGGAAPRWLVVHFDPMEGRNPLWEAPRTWREIACRYRIAERPADLLLLERRAIAATWRERELLRAPLKWGAWMELPAVLPGESLLARVELEPTAAGRVRRFLFRAEPVYLDLRAPGRRKAGRVLPDLAGQGLVLDAAPQDLAELAAWLGGEPRGGWRRVRWRSRDADRYRPATVRWSALRLEPPT